MMPIIKREKGENIPMLRDWVEDFFDEGSWGPLALRFPALREWQVAFPKVDITETDTNVMITANVPGVDPEKIEVNVDGDSIRLSGKIEKEAEQKDKKFYRFEREYGEFNREMALPARVDPEKVSAKSENGVLTITLPKSGEGNRKKIPVKKA